MTPCCSKQVWKLQHACIFAEQHLNDLNLYWHIIFLLLGAWNILMSLLGFYLPSELYFQGSRTINKWKFSWSLNTNHGGACKVTLNVCYSKMSCITKFQYFHPCNHFLYKCTFYKAIQNGTYIWSLVCWHAGSEIRCESAIQIRDQTRGTQFHPNHRRFV